jgi:NAD-reducing hydrogenase small subunit
VSKIRLATVWLDGCSGCHMSILDMDERLIQLADKFDLVYSPYVDAKIFPESVDITLVEGAISTDGDLEKIKKIRRRTKLLVALGDCAVTGNVSAMRNAFGVESVLNRSYIANASVQAQIPNEQVPSLLLQVCPVHEVVPVDFFVPGCPPAADIIYDVLSGLLEGRTPDLSGRIKFG